jgi:hypothetical protein
MITVTDTVPPGGWQYHQPETEFTLSSLDLNQLKQHIEAHRRSNKLDLSEGWWDRVQAEMCAANSEFAARHCDPNAIPPKLPKRFVADDLFRFFRTMREWGVGKKFKLVTPEEADSRRKICRGCPMNIEVTGCTECQGSLRWLAEWMSKEEARADDGLKNCGICRCVLRLKVLVPDEVLAKTVDPSEEYPAHCWMPKAKK